MEVYDSLVEAVSAMPPDDKRRIYSVEQGLNNRKYAIATSHGQAALAVLGEESVALVPHHERYLAMRDALHAAIERHNAKLPK